MEITLTTEAVDLVRRKGGTVALDLVRGVGCGKPTEVVADMFLKGKDLSSYLPAEQDGVTVLVSPAMSRSGAQVQVDTKGAAFWRTLQVRTDAAGSGSGSSCST
ncbi:MAG: hypothetical protein EA387_00515 [Nitriliruptor sp.]|nr:MAG: hypothetical protein EA387_00515 [Nitriliruptor sp.]